MFALQTSHFVIYLPPATKLGQGYIFTGVCHSVNMGGVCSWGVSAPGGGVCSQGVSAPGGVSALGGVCSRGGQVPGGDPPGTATAAGGTHPTGMHSCLK